MGRQSLNFGGRLELFGQVLIFDHRHKFWRQTGVIWAGSDLIWVGFDLIWAGLDPIWAGFDLIWAGKSYLGRL